jgi:Glycosyl transferases group 1
MSKASPGNHPHPGFHAGMVDRCNDGRLNSSELLQRKVVILSEIADAELAELYRLCLFTLYPSSYEGWGLPVTESLCHGKIPLTTAVSSLPEAGGDLAEYFDLRSEHDMLAKLERLIDDTSYREGREANIRQCFRPRNWVDIADEIVQRALDQETGSAVHPTLNRVQSDEIWPLPAEVGRYYPLSRSCETSIWTGTMGGEMYRIGQGWWSPDDWGTWLKREVADIAFTIAEAGNHPHLVYLGLRGGPGKPADYRIDVIGSGAQEDGVLDPEEHRWVVLTIESEAVRDAVIQIRLTTTGRCDLAEATHGEDRRIVTLGMLGFYVCREDDLLARHRFIEALQPTFPGFRVVARQGSSFWASWATTYGAPCGARGCRKRQMTAPRR